MVAISPRLSWAAQYADGDRTLSGLATEVFVHHTAGSLLPTNAAVATEQQVMRALEQTGQTKFGFGISYNVVIFPSGRAYQGVSWNRRGTHTGGRNSTARSICLAGNFDTAPPTPAALQTAAEIFHAGRGRWWTDDAPVRGHRDITATVCPGRYLYAELDTIRRPPTTAGLRPDGLWGEATTRRAQQVLGTVVDGEVSRQPRTRKDANPGLTGGWHWIEPNTQPEGSALIREIQRRVGVTRDGKIGPTTIRGIEARMRVAQSGTLSRGDPAIVEMQIRLNAGTF